MTQVTVKELAQVVDTPVERLLQQMREVSNLRFTGSIVEYGLSVSQRRRHQQVLGTGDSDHVSDDARALEFLRAGMDITALDANICAHGLQSLDVLVDRTGADRATTG